MDKKLFEAQIKSYDTEFNEFFNKVVSTVNDFVKENPDVGMYDLKSADGFSDNLCLSGAWIKDRINGFNGVPNSEKYRYSLTKKIRKVLGFTY